MLKSGAGGTAVCALNEWDSAWEGSCKTTPRREIPTFDLHTTSISTLYQTDSDEPSQWPSCEGSFDRQITEPSQESPAPGEASALNTSREQPGATVAACLHRVQNGIKTNNMLNKSLKDFCHIGFEYVNKLQELVNGMNIAFPGESNGAVIAIEALKSYINKTVESQREFLEAVSQECVIPEQCSEECAKIKREIQRSKSSYSEAESDRVALAASVEDLYLQSKEAVAMCSEAHHEPPLVKTRMHRELIPVLLKFINKSQELKAMPGDQSRSTFEVEMSIFKNSLRDLDQERIIGLRDCLSKFMVYETARLRNSQYDMSGLIKAINELEPEHEWSRFEEGGHLEVDTSESESIINAARQNARYLKNAIPEVFKNYALSRLTLSAPKARVLQRIERSLSKYLDAVWDEKLESVSLKDFVGEMQSSLVRQVFCSMVTSYSLRNNKLPSLSATKMLSRMIMAMLTFSQRQRDAWSGYAVLRVSSFIHVIKDPENEKPEKYPLRVFLHSHEYWSHIPFWEECLLITISQDLRVLFEDSSCCPALRPLTREAKSFKRWMVGFGISHMEANALIKRVCGQAGLPEEYGRCLIDSTDTL